MGDRLGERGTNGGLDERIAQKRDRKCWRSHLVASSLFRTSETMTTVGEQRRRLRGERRERFKHRNVSTCALCVARCRTPGACKLHVRRWRGPSLQLKSANTASCHPPTQLCASDGDFSGKPQHVRDSGAFPHAMAWPGACMELIPWALPMVDLSSW